MGLGLVVVSLHMIQTSTCRIDFHFKLAKMHVLFANLFVCLLKYTLTCFHTDSVTHLKAY